MGQTWTESRVNGEPNKGQGCHLMPETLTRNNNEGKLDTWLSLSPDLTLLCCSLYVNVTAFKPQKCYYNRFT